MTTLKINPNPTFESVVDVPLHGGGTAPVKCTFRHRSRKDMQAWIDTFNGRSDAELVMEMVTAWELDDALTMENVERLLDNYAGASRAILDVYTREISQARLKN